MNEKKYKSVVVIWGVILLTLQALALIDVVGLRPNLYNQLSKLETSFIAVGLLILILAYMLLSLNKKKIRSNYRSINRITLYANI